MGFLKPTPSACDNLKIRRQLADYRQEAQIEHFTEAFDELRVRPSACDNPEIRRQLPHYRQEAKIENLTEAFAAEDVAEEEVDCDTAGEVSGLESTAEFAEDLRGASL